MEKKKLENMLRSYPLMSQLIAERELEIKYPHRPVDENIGGGKAQNVRDESLERMIIKLVDDPQLKELHQQENAIAECLQATDPITYAIIDELYLTERRSLTQAGLALKYFMDERTVRKRRDKFLLSLDKKLTQNAG